MHSARLAVSLYHTRGSKWSKKKNIACCKQAVREPSESDILQWILPVCHITYPQERVRSRSRVH